MRKIILTFNYLILFLLLITPGCLDIPSEIILPEWSVDLNVPIVNKSYTLEEIVKSDEKDYVKLKPDEDSIYYIESDSYRFATDTSDIRKFVQIEAKTSKENVIVKVEDLEKNIFVDFRDSTKLDEAEFSSGFLKLVAKNLSNDTIGLRIELPAIKNPSGVVVAPTFVLMPYQSETKEFNLAGYKYKLPPLQVTWTLENFIWIKAKVTTNKPSDSVSVSAYVSDLGAKFAKGYIPKRSLGEKKDTFEIKVGSAKDFEGKVQLKEAKIRLKAKYYSPQSNPFEIELDSIQIIAKKKDGSQKALLINNEPMFKVSFYGGSFDTVYSESNTNITEFLSFLPDEVILKGVFILNPKDDQKYHIITAQDSIVFETEFSTRSIFAISKSSIKDTFKIELTTEERDRVKDALGANITVELQNAIPMTAWVKADLYDSLYNYLFTVTKNSNNTDSVNVNGAFVGADGHVTATNFSTTKIELNSSQIQLLSRAHHAIYSVTVETSNHNNQQPPPLIYLKGSDWMKVRAYGGVKYHLKPEDEK